MHFKTFNYKFIIGLLLLVAGLVLIGYSIDAIRQIAQAKGTFKDIQNFFTHNPTWNPLIKFFGGQAQKKASAYDLQALLCLLSGIVLAVGGAILAFRYRKKSSFF